MHGGIIPDRQRNYSLIGDILIMEGNPAQNISDSRNVRSVFLRGKLLDRKTLLSSGE